MNQSSLNRSAARPQKDVPQTARNEVVKNELLEGHVISRPPANRRHNLIASNFTVGIGSRYNRSGCELYTGDMQVLIGKNSICYPDVVVVSGVPSFTTDREDVLQNPTLVIEIISNSQRSSERTVKLEGFLAVPHIKECLLVNENEMRIEHYSRQNAKQWIYRIYNERDDVISLDSIGCKLTLGEVYTQVKFPDGALDSSAVN